VKALKVSGERKVEVIEVEKPKAGPGEVVVEMKSTAICGSDLHPYRHPTPLNLDPGFISGHEPAGIIHEIGPGVTGWNVGDRVIAYFRRTCGECHFCQIGHRNVCLNRRSSYGHQGLDGSHAEYMRVEAPCLMRLPDHLSFLDGAIIACQGGTAFYPLTRMGVSGRDVLVVSGLGPVGMLATLFAKAMGAHVVGIDPSGQRRELAASLGADETLDPTAEPVGEQLQKTHKLGADKLIETSGSNAAHAVIGDLLKPMGHAALVGLGSSEFKMPLMRIVHRQLTIIGTSIYPNSQYEEICDFTKDHGLELSRIVTHTLPLADGPEAYRLAETAGVGKVAFSF
jgi:propanol-preferring alcohol dehydrogenase